MYRSRLNYYATLSIFLVGAAAFFGLTWLLVREFTGSGWTVRGTLGSERFVVYILVGFLAQLIDGALGMAYGVSSTTLLLTSGVPPAAASASVHVAEVFATAASGISHFRLGNINWRLFRALAVPGAAGAVLGAFVLTSFEGEAIRPYVSAYLLVMGTLIVLKAFRKGIVFRERGRVWPLAVVGGFADASGGGGWGPVVTSTLIGTGGHPRFTIGTVNTSEFFVALAASGVFTIVLGMGNWDVIAGLIVGGVVAAPLGAYVCRSINVRVAMIAVGLVVAGLSIRNIVLSFQ